MRKSVWYDPVNNRLAITSWSFEESFGLGCCGKVDPNTWIWIGEL
jgi:hypothetical protein